jgi:hypothetical protein
MTRTGRVRTRAISATIGLLAAFTLTMVAFPGAAQARCNGASELTNLFITSDGTVTENPVNGTCNGNDFYASDYSSDTNGWRASIHIQNNGLWSSWYGGYDTNTYHLEYRDNNSNSLIHMCLDNGFTFHCGQGTTYVTDTVVTHTISASNTGF